MSLHVIVKLPDGRLACADYRQPIVHVMRRHLRRVGMSDAEAKRKGTGLGSPADLADLAIVAEWLDHCPEQACPYAHPDHETCGGKHPPASREPYTPPPYNRPVLDGLW